jgi:hypothetical protein
MRTLCLRNLKIDSLGMRCINEILCSTLIKEINPKNVPSYEVIRVMGTLLKWRLHNVPMKNIYISKISIPRAFKGKIWHSYIYGSNSSFSYLCKKNLHMRTLWLTSGSYVLTGYIMTKNLNCCNILVCLNITFKK